MSEHSNDIEERLVPFVEGVLNAREEAEVRKAIESDPELAREVQELRDVIKSVRAGFASGVKPPQEELTPEEVVELAAHDGRIESMPGSSELKARLFSSDQALEEYRLLQSLRSESLGATMDMSDVPAMPESLRKEFQALKNAKPSNVVEFPAQPSLWARSVGFFERINPKPLMASAAALALLTLGVHYYGQPPSQAPAASGERVAMGNESKAKPPLPEGTAAGKLGEGGGSAQPSSPPGVTVFTSDDKDLLKEQAEKLLANKVRYTVTEDRILVSEKELDTAKKALWGEGVEETVAIAEKPKREALRPAPRLKEATPPLESREVARKSPTFQPSSADPAKPMTRYDLRKTRTTGRVSADEAPKKSKASELSHKSDQASTGSTPEPALKAPAKPVPAEDKPNTVSPKSASNYQVATESAAPRKANNETAEERKNRLRKLALGQSQSGGEEPADSEAPEATQVEMEDKSPPVEVNYSRARSAPEPPVEQVPPAVANVVTKDFPTPERDDDGSLNEDRGGAVAAKNMPKGAVLDPGAAAIEGQKTEIDGASEGDAQSTIPSRPSLEVAAPGSAGGLRRQAKRGAPKPAAVEPPPAPVPAQTQQATQEEIQEISTGYDEDTRVAAIREAQPGVARRYNVVLSVEQRGSKVTVYVRPRGELSKSEIEELRKAIRRELGLSAADSVVFR